MMSGHEHHRAMSIEKCSSVCTSPPRAVRTNTGNEGGGTAATSPAAVTAVDKVGLAVAPTCTFIAPNKSSGGLGRVGGRATVDEEMRIENAEMMPESMKGMMKKRWKARRLSLLPCGTMKVIKVVDYFEDSASVTRTSTTNESSLRLPAFHRAYQPRGISAEEQERVSQVLRDGGGGPHHCPARPRACRRSCCSATTRAGQRFGAAAATASSLPRRACSSSSRGGGIPRCQQHPGSWTLHRCLLLLLTVQWYDITDFLFCPFAPPSRGPWGDEDMSCTSSRPSTAASTRPATTRHDQGEDDHLQGELCVVGRARTTTTKLLPRRNTDITRPPSTTTSACSYSNTFGAAGAHAITLTRLGHRVQMKTKLQPRGVGAARAAAAKSSREGSATGGRGGGTTMRTAAGASNSGSPGRRKDKDSSSSSDKAKNPAPSKNKTNPAAVVPMEVVDDQLQDTSKSSSLTSTTPSSSFKSPSIVPTAVAVAAPVGREELPQKTSQQPNLLAANNNGVKGRESSGGSTAAVSSSCDASCKSDESGSRHHLPGGGPATNVGCAGGNRSADGSCSSLSKLASSFCRCFRKKSSGLSSGDQHVSPSPAAVDNYEQHVEEANVVSPPRASGHRPPSRGLQGAPEDGAAATGGAAVVPDGETTSTARGPGGAAAGPGDLQAGGIAGRAAGSSPKAGRRDESMKSASAIVEEEMNPFHEVEATAITKSATAGQTLGDKEHPTEQDDAAVAMSVTEESRVSQAEEMPQITPVSIEHIKGVLDMLKDKVEKRGAKIKPCDAARAQGGDTSILREEAAVPLRASGEHATGKAVDAEAVASIPMDVEMTPVAENRVHLQRNEHETEIQSRRDPVVDSVAQQLESMSLEEAATMNKGGEEQGTSGVSAPAGEKIAVSGGADEDEKMPQATSAEESEDTARLLSTTSKELGTVSGETPHVDQPAPANTPERGTRADSQEGSGAANTPERGTRTDSQGSTSEKPAAKPPPGRGKPPRIFEGGRSRVPSNGSAGGVAAKAVVGSSSPSRSADNKQDARSSASSLSTARSPWERLASASVGDLPRMDVDWMVTSSQMTSAVVCQASRCADREDDGDSDDQGRPSGVSQRQRPPRDDDEDSFEKLEEAADRMSYGVSKPSPAGAQKNGEDGDDDDDDDENDGCNGEFFDEQSESGRCSFGPAAASDPGVWGANFLVGSLTQQFDQVAQLDAVGRQDSKGGGRSSRAAPSRTPAGGAPPRSKLSSANSRNRQLRMKSAAGSRAASRGGSRAGSACPSATATAEDVVARLIASDSNSESDGRTSGHGSRAESKNASEDSGESGGRGSDGEDEDGGRVSFSSANNGMSSSHSACGALDPGPRSFGAFARASRKPCGNGNVERIMGKRHGGLGMSRVENSHKQYLAKKQRQEEADASGAGDGSSGGAASSGLYRGVGGGGNTGRPPPGMFSSQLSTQMKSSAADMRSMSETDFVPSEKTEHRMAERFLQHDQKTKNQAGEKPATNLRSPPGSDMTGKEMPSAKVDLVSSCRSSTAGAPHTDESRGNGSEPQDELLCTAPVEVDHQVEYGCANAAGSASGIQAGGTRDASAGPEKRHPAGAPGDPRVFGDDGSKPSLAPGRSTGTNEAAAMTVSRGESCTPGTIADRVPVSAGSCGDAQERRASLCED
ncbi:unnamed protein product [Amoebophrya sp. A120]|nr:unnamed protein product [Amoebophrya sp. A120]|eukprot:GSA120T00020577001.1